MWPARASRARRPPRRSVRRRAARTRRRAPRRRRPACATSVSGTASSARNGGAAGRGLERRASRRRCVSVAQRARVARRRSPRHALQRRSTPSPGSWRRAAKAALNVAPASSDSPAASSVEARSSRRSDAGRLPRARPHRTRAARRRAGRAGDRRRRARRAARGRARLARPAPRASTRACRSPRRRSHSTSAARIRVRGRAMAVVATAVRLVRARPPARARPATNAIGLRAHRRRQTGHGQDGRGKREASRIRWRVAARRDSSRRGASAGRLSVAGSTPFGALLY